MDLRSLVPCSARDPATVYWGVFYSQRVEVSHGGTFESNLHSQLNVASG